MMISERAQGNRSLNSHTHQDIWNRKQDIFTPIPGQKKRTRPGGWLIINSTFGRLLRWSNCRR